MSVAPDAPVAPITRADIDAAAGRIDRLIRHTPVIAIDADDLDVAHDGRLTLKLDHLQQTGAFKARGAASLLTASERVDAGVVAASGGNFGVAIAWAAHRLNWPATIFVPATSPDAKLAAIRRYDVDLQVVDGYYADALEAANRHAQRTGALSAHAYDHPLVIAGQGTLARELDAQADVDVVIVACGGGGLLAGTAAWMHPHARVVAVETHGTAAFNAAVAAGQPVDVDVSGIAASSLGARRIGQHPWAHRDLVAESLLVSDADVEHAQALLWQRCRIVAEPGGAVALAALTSGAFVPGDGQRVAVVVCGGNTDLATVKNMA
ncbi:MAG: serine/threonine dehydratase [Nitriliruptoraceae bacterium]